ncbi:MAG: FecR domain-containing protein [Elusimicrobia bacterium]|nr:FecR domain-containing protein [Elusimicrobiota bacterium]
MEILIKRVAAFLVLLGLSAALSAPAGAVAAGPIRLIPNGLVDVREGGNAPWRPVAGPETVSAGQEIRTHRNASAELTFSDGSKVLINSFSIFSIDRTDSREESFSLKLGRIRAAFAGLLSSHITIHTPTAVAAVRGTVFDVGVDGKDTQVTMAEGVLEVKDNQGREAVVTSEETMKIGENGLERPHMLPLDDPRALQAVRPYAVHQEMARDATRTMLEDLRNRELKANEAQLGKDVVDAYGRRVRLEEYLLRPDAKSFELLFLSHRQDRFDWGHYIQTFHAAIPNDLSQVPAIVASGFLAQNQPTNWLTSLEFYATNTVDADKEKLTLGDPTQINFAGYNAGVAKLLWYPSSVNFTQTLIGPGVPGGSRIQFEQNQDYNATVAGQFFWSQKVQATAGTNDLQTALFATLDPTNVANVNTGYTNLTTDAVLYPAIQTVQTTPSGPNNADLRTVTKYPDGSTVGVEKFLISNEGKILDFSNPTSDIFNHDGTYNLEINIQSSLFQGRDIDVLVAPEILRQKNLDATTPNSLKP